MSSEVISGLLNMRATVLGGADAGICAENSTEESCASTCWYACGMSAGGEGVCTDVFWRDYCNNSTFVGYERLVTCQCGLLLE